MSAMYYILREGARWRSVMNQYVVRMEYKTKRIKRKYRGRQLKQEEEKN